MEERTARQHEREAGARDALARDRWVRLALKFLYWAAVLAVSLALVAGLVFLLESHDPSSLG
jgi:hypothetical protein